MIYVLGIAWPLAALLMSKLGNGFLAAWFWMLTAIVWGYLGYLAFARQEPRQ